MSAESGISTFRDSGGLWEQYKVEDVASIEGYYRNRKLVLDFYNHRRNELGTAKPNAGHEGVAALEKDFNVTVITQNIDNLHERAGSTHVVHLHGEATKVRPENTFNDRDGYSEREVFDVGYSAVHLGDKAPNGVQLRPHIVFFGEAVPKIEMAIDIVSRADIVLIVGTSLSVYPAAGLYRYAPSDAPVYIIDPKPVGLADKRLHPIQAVATEGMKLFIKELDNIK
jgi:NAD-dependent deacetylase